MYMIEYLLQEDGMMQVFAQREIKKGDEVTGNEMVHWNNDNGDVEEWWYCWWTRSLEEAIWLDSNNMDGSAFESTFMLMNQLWQDDDLFFVELSATEADYDKNDEDCENSLDADSGDDGDDGYNVD